MRQTRAVDRRWDLLGLAGLVLTIGDKVACRHLQRKLAEVGVGVHIDERVRLIGIIISNCENTESVSVREHQERRLDVDNK